MADPKADWDDLNWFIGEYIPRQTIPILRRFGAHVEHRTRLVVGIRAGDKKADIVEKVSAAFRQLKARNELGNYTAIRTLCENEGNFVGRATAGPTNYGPPPTFGGVPNGMNGAQRYAGYASASTSAYRPAAAAPAAGPSRNGWTSQSTTTAYGVRTPTLQDWKANPMWKPIKALTNMEMLPDIGPSENNHTRKDRKVHITLGPDIIDKLTTSKANPTAHPQYSVRLFCTSNDYFKPPNTPYSPANSMINNQQIPIEYPTNPDVYVDDFAIPFKERGLRGKPGSAPPFDLDRGQKGLSKVAGRMTSINMGHTGPSVGKKKDVSKKFFFQIVFCEITTTAELQKRIDKMVPADAEHSLGLLRKKQDDDDDIVFGQSRMSLKDPLSYMRIVLPIRSSKCSHLQCFEAKWWILGNEKHPQWLCPLCNRALRFDELIVDGFSLDILDVVPEQYDEVVIEADNAWHTEDGAYGSAAWLRLNAKSNKPTREPTAEPEKEDAKPDRFRLSSSPDLKGKRKAIEILSSDDEGDDERPLAKVNTAQRGLAVPSLANRQASAVPSTSAPPPPTKSAGVAGGGVIDLTLSDSEDDDDDEEDAVTGFDRPSTRNEPDAGSNVIPPAAAKPPHRTSFSGARSPSVDFYRNAAGHSNGNGNNNGNGHGESSHLNGRPTFQSSGARGHVDRYVPPYMPNPNNNSNNDRSRDRDRDRYFRPPDPSAPAPARTYRTDDTRRPDPVDSWRSDVHASHNTSYGRTDADRIGDRDRMRDRDRDRDTDSDDDEYRWR